MNTKKYNPYEENIEKFIFFINDLATDLFYEKFMCSGEYLFQNGACYEFIKIIRNYFDINNILIEESYDHCAFEYNGNYYDSRGLIKDKENFRKATENEILYIEDNFGGHLKWFHIFETITSEIEHIEDVPYLPEKFYLNKIKTKRVR